jgi:hypothetical protein
MKRCVNLTSLQDFGSSGLQDVWMEISQSNFLPIDVPTSRYFGASGDFERGHKYLPKLLSPG